MRDGNFCEGPNSNELKLQANWKIQAVINFGECIPGITVIDAIDYSLSLN